MSQHTIMILGGIAIAALGLAYIFSKPFALKMFYYRAFRIENLMERFLSERAGVALIRFGLGPILVLAGLTMIVVSRSARSL